jgi:hypothetical protein
LTGVVVTAVYRPHRNLPRSPRGSSSRLHVSRARPPRFS